jgi:hypothetical protein
MDEGSEDTLAIGKGTLIDWDRSFELAVCLIGLGEAVP